MTGTAKSDFEIGRKAHTLTALILNPEQVALIQNLAFGRLDALEGCPADVDRRDRMRLRELLAALAGVEPESQE